MKQSRDEKSGGQAIGDRIVAWVHLVVIGWDKVRVPGACLPYYDFAGDRGDRAERGFGADALLQLGDGRRGSMHAGRIGQRFQRDGELPRLAGAELDDAAHPLLERLDVGKVRGRFQPGDVAVASGFAVLPKRKAGELPHVEFQAHALCRRRIVEQGLRVAVGVRPVP